MSDLAAEIERLARHATHETLYAEEGTPHIYRDWAGRKVIVATVQAPEWHEDRLCGGREAFANAELWAFLRNNLPTILAALRASRPEPEPAADAVEAVAGAICAVEWNSGNRMWDDFFRAGREKYRAMARAALSALPRPEPAQLRALVQQLREEAAGATDDRTCSGIARIADAIEAALPRSAVDEGAGGWRLIKTAPKDRWILGWAPGCIPQMMSWFEVPSRGVVGHWHGFSRGYSPTYWHPLPPMPNTLAAAQEGQK